MNIVGIDLGTTNSLIAMLCDGEMKILSRLPSTIVVRDGRISIGAEYDEGDKESGSICHILRSTKRLMGRSLSDLRGVDGASEFIFDAEAASRGEVRCICGEQSFAPVDIATMILSKLKEEAELVLNDKISRAVITVPAYFDDTQRNATRLAAKNAGLDVMRLINEPTAAAIAYGDMENEAVLGKVLVYDLGGGTFDVSVLEVREGVLQVISTAGDTMLGGDDFDHALRNFLNDKYGCSLSNAQCRLIKEKLSDEGTYNLNGAVLLCDDIFATIWCALVDKTIDIMKRAVYDAGAEFDIAKIIFVGGATRMQQIRDRVAKIFSAESVCDLNPDEVVAYGAGIQAAALNGKSSDLLIDVNPLSLGIETKDGLIEPLIFRNTAIPALASKIFGVQHEEQKFVKIHVLQGEGERVEECRSLAKFTIRCDEGMKSRVKVTFCVDANGILSVMAMNELTNESKEIYCAPSHSLTQSEMMQLMQVQGGENDT